jgi:zinc-ribbon domain
MTCRHCGSDVADTFRFCPWCAAPQRRKLVEFFHAHPRDAEKALRVSRYLTDDPQVRFSVWNEDGVATAAISLEEREAQRLAAFLAQSGPRSLRERIASLVAR